MMKLRYSVAIVLLVSVTGLLAPGQGFPGSCFAQYIQQAQRTQRTPNGNRYQVSNHSRVRTSNNRQRSRIRTNVTAATASAGRSDYRLDSGDVLAVIVQGVLGDHRSAPVHIPRAGDDVLPSIGFPFVVRDDGTVNVPLIDPVLVRGLTILQAENQIEAAYFDAGVLQGKNLVRCGLMRKRTVDVLVVHDRNPRSLPGQQNKAVSRVRLPADDATPLRALAEAGGFFDSGNIQIVRPESTGTEFTTQSVFDSGVSSGSLSSGDIVQAPLPQPGFFFATGLLNPGRYELNSGQPLNAVQAIARAGGAGIGGPGLGPSELVLTRGNQAVRYNLNSLLNDPNRVIIQPGDTISVRPTIGDVLGNTALDALRFGIIRGF